MGFKDLHRNFYETAQLVDYVGEYDENDEYIITYRNTYPSFEEYLEQTGQRQGPSVGSQIVAGVLGGISGYQMAKRRREKSKKEREAELERQRKAAIRQAQAERLKSDRELIKKRATEQVRMELVRNYDYHEMMTHYFLGIDEHGRPFDIDRFGVPYYLDTDSLAYAYYTPENVDPKALEYSDAKRQRLGLASLSKLPASKWVTANIVDNHPRNLDNILADEAKIRAYLVELRENDEQEEAQNQKQRQKDEGLSL